MWYSRVTADISLLPDFISYYENELETAKSEVKISGSLDRSLTLLPGITETRFSQLQEIEAVLCFLEVELKKIRRQYFQKYLENYNRALTSRDAEKYTDGEEAVLDQEKLIIEVSLLRNKYLGILKGLESKNFMLGHITKLRVVGLDDAMAG